MSNIGKPPTLSQISSLLKVRKFTKLPAETSILSALALLQKNEYDLLILDSTDSRGRDPQRPLVVSGYSIISKLVHTSPSRYGDLLQSTCLEAALAAGTISNEYDLISLFHVFESTTFGFALIHDASNSITDKISVKDLLSLYQNGVLSSDLIANDIATKQVFSLSNETKIVDCMQEMVRRKFRRVCVPGTKSMISDRQILSYVFDEKKVQGILKMPEHLLDGTLNEVASIQATWVDGQSKIREAAKALSMKKEPDCLLSDRGIITPWDLIIKPWRFGELKVVNKIA